MPRSSALYAATKCKLLSGVPASIARMNVVQDAWRLSNTLHADFCVDALEEALRRFGRPEIFNTDQGSQFTSTDFTGVLKASGSAWTARAGLSGPCQDCRAGMIVLLCHR